MLIHRSMALAVMVTDLHGCSACGAGTVPQPMLSSSRSGGLLQRRLASLRSAMHVIFAK